MTNPIRQFTIISGALFIVTAIVLSGCASSKQMAAAPPAETPDPPLVLPVRVLTDESVFYRLNQHRFTEETLIGSGWSEKLGVTRAFEGQIPMNDIDYIEVD